MNVTQSETASVTAPENCGFKCERTWARIPAVGPRANYTASLSLIVLICEMGRLLTFLFHVSFKESKNYSIWKCFIHDAVLNSTFLVWDKSLKVCNVSKRNHACFLCLPQNNNFFFLSSVSHHPLFLLDFSILNDSQQSEKSRELLFCTN